MNPGVDHYLIAGCGRCTRYNTPDCSIHRWRDAIMELRRILLSCGLSEELKWSNPCYTDQKKNICIIGAFREWCTISFFKGALLSDSKELLEKAGAHTHSARVVRITSVQQVLQHEDTLRQFIHEAIALEREGKKVMVEKQPEPMPAELVAVLNKNGALKRAFEALTPGRQRGYILHFSEPRQSKTRESRIEKCIPMILEGKGIHDDYKRK
jgi:uncharacterized protein YdeI (YjbR/CyaY-like superfamily)